MKTWVRKTLSVGVLAAGALLFAPGAAQADVHQSTGDNNGILNGTQIAVPVRVPVNVVGNSLGILGVANAQGAGVNFTESGRHHRQSTGDNNGILNGTQAYLPISVPVNVVGNSAAVLGHAQAAGVGVNGVRGRKAESARTTEHGWPGNGGQSTGNNNGILNGTQLYAPIDIPINICGNSLAVLGGSYSSAVCANGGWGHGVHQGGKWKKESVRTARGGWQSTGDNNGIANGTQLYAPINLPVNLAGNSVAVLGSAGSRAVAVNEKGHRDGFGQSTGDNNGILNGTQIAAPISIPINVCGNSLGILGAAQSVAACANDVDGGFFGGDDDWDGHHGGGHGHGHKPGHGNGGDNGGDNGAVDDDDNDYKGDGDVADDDNDGYTKPAGNANAGYGDVQDDKYDSDDDKAQTGGRRGKAEASPVTGLTETVGGVGDNAGLGSLGLLSTLR